MKKILIAVVCAAGVLTSSCSDFLDRMPLTEPNNETFLVSERQVLSYINGLYIALPSFSQYGMGLRAEEKNSDNILSESYDKRINGEYTAFSGDTEWSTGYENLRDVNYFLHYYMIDEAAESANAKSLRGEAYFLRAYWHFYLLKRFGSIPFMDDLWDDRATVAGLQIEPKPRNEVAKLILKDLETAASLLHDRSVYKGLRISREAAIVLAMNVALFEGSWEKYHAGGLFAAPTNESQYFFEQVIAWGDKLPISSLKLNTQASDPFGCEDAGDAYAHLFNQKDYSNVPEAIFWKKYSIAEGVYHSVTTLLGSGVVDNEGAAGLSKSLVDNYLNADGSYINPKDDKYKDFNAMFMDRDLRLTETVMSSGHAFRSTSMTRPMLVEEYTEENAEEVLPPYLLGDGNGRNITGFHTALGTDETYVNETFWDTGLILIRSAEALLAYAEAAEELGKCTPDILSETIKPLRERAGVTYTDPSTWKNDPNFSNFGYSLTPVLQEIRRERRAELALQGFRLDDLMRWRGASLIVNQRGRGAYLGPDGVLYKSFNLENEETVASLDLVLVDADGWMDPLQQLLPGGYQFQTNRDYLLPIPPDELELNKLMSQNPNW